MASANHTPLYARLTIKRISSKGDKIARIVTRPAETPLAGFPFQTDGKSQNKRITLA